MSHVVHWPSPHDSLLMRIRDPADQQAWSTFVDLYGPPIYRFCTRQGLQAADAADVAQNVLLKVIRSIGTFRYDPARGQFRSWLGTVAIREIGAYCRKLQAAGRGRGADRPAFRELPEARVRAEWVAAFNAQLFQRALERIQGEFSPQVGRAFERVWLHEEPPQAVARALDRPPQWVYKTKFRVLRRLRQEVLFLTSDAALFAKD